MAQYVRLKILFILALIVLLMLLNVCWGSVNIPLERVVNICLGGEESNESWRFIVYEVRVPQLLTALLAGSGLSGAGLLLQTAFRNPMAGPSVFGITSGAGLGAALVMLLMGGALSVSSLSLSGYWAVFLGAFSGALGVTLLLFGISLRVDSTVALLVVGLMTGYLVSSVSSVLYFFSSADGIRAFTVWGMGSFGTLPLRLVPFFGITVVLCLALSVFLLKPLNVLLLGEKHARAMGISVRSVRTRLLLLTSVLVAVVTACCGPVSFIGLAVPHIARLFMGTENHRLLMPATLLLGAVVALSCNLLCALPGDMGVLPLNAVTPLVGAPVIVYVLLRRK